MEDHAPAGLPTVDLDFTGQEPIPASAVARANELMESGRLFRYGELTAGEDDAALLEEEFARLVGRSYCVAFNSCGASMAAALIAAGVSHGDKVEDRFGFCVRLTTPNFSMRMTALAAALIRPQLGQLPQRARLWNERYAWLEELLSADPRISLPHRHRDEDFVGSSIQFMLDSPAIGAVIELAAANGVHIKWFGADAPAGFTSRFDHWQYAPAQRLEASRDVLSSLCDMRIPLAMTASQAADIASVIRGSLDRCA